jgi:hypothetical protein
LAVNTDLVPLGKSACQGHPARSYVSIAVSLARPDGPSNTRAKLRRLNAGR